MSCIISTCTTRLCSQICILINASCFSTADEIVETGPIFCKNDMNNTKINYKIRYIYITARKMLIFV